MEEAIGEGLKAMEPSIVEIFTFLERTIKFSYAWAQSQPEHEEALDKFIKDLDQVGCELKNSALVKVRCKIGVRSCNHTLLLPADF